MGKMRCIAGVVWVLLLATSLVGAGSAQERVPTVSGPVRAPVGVPAAPATQAVFWDQPLSAVNHAGYVDQEFPDFPEYSSYLADDFTNDESWWLDTFFVPGDGWNGFSSLLNAESLTWQIYADDGGRPAGDPVHGGAFWSITLPPTDPQVTLSAGTSGYPSDVTLELHTVVEVPPGHWWLAFYPTMPLYNGGQYGRQASDTLNEFVGQFINPGGGFGYGSEWQPWTGNGPAQQDIAFRLEGPICCPIPIFVQDIRGHFELDPFGRTVLNMHILVYDLGLQPVKGVRVDATITPPAGGDYPRTRTTKQAGWARFHWGSNSPGAWRICVDNLTLEGYVYDPSQNVYTCREWEN